MSFTVNGLIAPVEVLWETLFVSKLFNFSDMPEDFQELIRKRIAEITLLSPEEMRQLGAT